MANAKERETIESLTQKLGPPGIKWDYTEMDQVGGELIAVKAPSALVTQALLADLKNVSEWSAGLNYVAGCLITPDRARFEVLLNEQAGLIEELVPMCKALASSRIVRRKKG